MESLVPYPEMLKRVWCLDQFGFKLDKASRFKQIRASWNSWANETNREELQSFEEGERMNYSSHIVDAADRITNGLRPYVAIQWDLENANSRFLDECVERLVKRVQKSVDRTRIENIYMATDYPLFDIPLESGEKSHSVTWNYVTPAHHSAIELLKSQIPLDNWASLEALDNLGMKLKGEYGNIKEIREEIVKTGINRIVERIVCVHADWFVGMPRFPCNSPLDNKMSKLIVDERTRLLEKGYNGVKNNVTRF
ncbi:12094_t:CDS:2 [Acaulospora colombiana]|uniref:12094_t:CDS:1 n=1 Tax=Acaulospora colombiana TaxID=27376 RepID=A0ACA9LKP3_9GLOM|nr:12094_t:CDS:2 [Acaulospora colombiana]